MENISETSIERRCRLKRESATQKSTCDVTTTDVQSSQLLQN
ncbi:23858_t:CDS:2, partial [Gigaspora rosea]